MARVRLDPGDLDRVRDDIADLRADLAALRREGAEYRAARDAELRDMRNAVRDDVVSLQRAVAENEREIHEVRRTVELGVDRGGSRPAGGGPRK
jgi:chromosome segregation ATPase